MTLAADLAADILTRRDTALRRDAGPWPRTQPVPSDLSDCTRAMVLSVLHWNQRPAFEPYVKARLNRGNLLEDAILRELADLGFRVRQDRHAFEVKDRKGRVVLRGRLDGFLQLADRTEIPLECKSVDPNVFRSLVDLEAFGRYWYTRRWPMQLRAYCYAENFEEGILLLDDCLGHWRPIVVPLDIATFEPIIRRCEDTVEALELHRTADYLPPWHADASVCARCWCLNRMCFPPLAAQGLTTIEDEELERKLRRREELAPRRQEYEALDAEVKERFKGKGGVVVGPYLIQGKETVTHRKAQEAKTVMGWRTTITALDGQEDE
jgi:hypothetical protein